jgi:hypothetical protein
MWNEVALCPWCHAARHAGLLEIEGSPLEGFRFNPSLKKAAPPLDEELKLFASLGIEISRGPSACADKLRRPAKEIALFARGLKRTFGYGLNEAKEWLEAAEKRLIAKLGRMPTDEELVGAAVRGR